MDPIRTTTTTAAALACGDIPESSFEASEGDPHRFDADDDGIGCGEDEGTTPPSTAAPVLLTPVA